MWLGIAGLMGLSAVAAGAFGAHALRSQLPPDLFEVFQTGALYHLTHALALVGAAFLHRQRPTWLAWLSALCFLLGIVVFCGSLYALALSGNRALGMITPIGGVLLMVGWGGLAGIGFSTAGTRQDAKSDE